MTDLLHGAENELAFARNFLEIYLEIYPHKKTREISLTLTKIEEAEMWLEKHLKKEDK